MTNLDFDVCIVGGGMAGLTLAAALKQTISKTGLRVALLDRVPLNARLAANFDTRTTALSLGTRRIFEGLGLWNQMAPNAAAIERILIKDQMAATDMVFDARDVAEPAFGWIVQNMDVRRVLAEAISSASITDIQGGVKSSRLSSGQNSKHKRTLVLEDGQQISAQLVVGADGRDSMLRSMARIPVTRKTYDHKALVCVLRHERPHSNWALELFLPEGPFATLPLQDPHCSALVWSGAKAGAWHKLPQTEFEALVQPHVAETHGRVTLEPSPNGGDSRAVWPLSLCVSQRYISDRLALVSDAARAFHPIAGQAFNLGMRDIATLAELIHDQAGLGLDVGAPDCLKRYQRRRRFDGALMAASTDSLVSLFGLRPTTKLRRFGLKMVDGLPGIKSMLMRHAMGIPDGTVIPPARLLSGQTL